LGGPVILAPVGPVVYRVPAIDHADHVLDRLLGEATAEEEARGARLLSHGADEAPRPRMLGLEPGDRFGRDGFGDPLPVEPRENRGVTPARRRQRGRTRSRKPRVIDEPDLLEPRHRGFRRGPPNASPREPILETACREIAAGERTPRRGARLRGAELAPERAKKRPVDFDPGSKTEPSDDIVGHGAPGSAVELEDNLPRTRAANRRQTRHNCYADEVTSFAPSRAPGGGSRVAADPFATAPSVAGRRREDTTASAPSCP
jgi:hypothetical protein